MHNSITIFKFPFYTFAFFLFTFSFSLAQESKIAKIDSIQTINSNLPNAPLVEEGDVKITDGTNTLIRITDEGTFGAIEIKTGAPSTTTDKLYNDGGTLKFNGSSLGGGSGATQINDLTDAIYDGSSLFLGNGAGANDDGTNNKNSAIGNNALKENTTGSYNTANGYESLKHNTIGNANVGIGENANYYNQEGSNNTMIGFRTGEGVSNHNKSGNIFLGFQAGFYETSDNKLYIENTNSASPLIWGDFTDGSEKVKINGDFQVTGNVTGVEIDDLTDAKYDGSSLFLGSGAGKLDDGNNRNTAIGKDAFSKNTTGISNTAIGYWAHFYNTTGSHNVGIGESANDYNQEGSQNTIVGFQAGQGTVEHNKSGSVFLGFQAGRNETSDDKLYIENSSSSTPLIWGDFANDEVKINGDFEVIGSVALGSNTTANGSNSVAIGSYASTNNLSGSMMLTDNSTTTVLNSSSIDRMTMRFDKGYRLYSNAAADVGVYMNAGGNSWLSTSDSTKKENFKSVDGEELLNKISHFKLTSWNYKSQDPTKFRHYGPMAQDFYAAFGNDGIGVIGNDTTIASADFDGINLIAIQALETRTKKQDERIKTLEKENQNLKTVIMENKDLKDEMNIIKAALNRLVKEQSPVIKFSKNSIN